VTPPTRPPWWPEEEPWPPPLRSHRGSAWAGGHRRRGGRGGGRGFGCLFGLAFLVLFVVAIAFVSSLLYALGLFGNGGGPGVVQVLALLIVIVGVVSFAGVGGAFRRSGGTLDALVEATRTVEAGDYSVRVEETRRTPRPVRELVRGFNTMAERLEIDERQRRSLLADVSHELRTPLAIVQGNIEAMLDGVHAADDAHLEAILDETRVLARLVEDLRTVALSEAGTLALHREATDLEVLAGDVAAAFEPVAAAADLRIEVEFEDDLPLLDLDPVRIREVLTNLVSNALRYGRPSGRIRLSGRRDPDGTVRIEVADSGTGIAPEALAHVFDRFSRSSDSRGSGLGLAIARSLVEAHGGTIEAVSGPDGGIDGGPGTTFTIRLPAAGEA
jgi:two-component system sensor histidine kinase BaeS